MDDNGPFDIHEFDGVTVLDVHLPSRGLALTTPDYMAGLWKHLYRVAADRQKVLVIYYSANALSADRVDDTWQDIMSSHHGSGELPPQIRALQTNMKKLIDYFQSTKTLCIGVFSGAIDLDMFGLFASCHYRICSSNTLIENKTLERNAPPGSASIWFLSRVVGFARAAQIFLDEEEITADQALEMRLVNAVMPDDGLRDFAMEKAQSFAAKPERALRTLVFALNHAHTPLTDYLDQVGTGFAEMLRE